MVSVEGVYNKCSCCSSTSWSYQRIYGHKEGGWAPSGQPFCLLLNTIRNAIRLNRPFEETYWRKVKQMQPLYNQNHGEILWENVAPYWPVMDPAWSSPVKITIAYKDMLPCNLTGTSCLVHSLKENAASICGVLLRRTFGDTEVRLVDQLFLYQAFSVLSACEISSN